MLKANNVVAISGGIVAEPEILGKNNNILRLRIAVDYAGSDSENPDNRSGYFDVTYFLNDETPNVSFVRSQLERGYFKKGTQLSIVGSLEQRRWATESGERRSIVKIVAHDIGYSGRAPSTNSGSASASASSASSSSDEDYLDIPEDF